VVSEKAVELVENQGIVFLDEIDKVCGPPSAHGPDVSRQGVQRDPAPGRRGDDGEQRAYGPVRTDHILFIAAGAFHASKPGRPDARVAGAASRSASKLTDLKKGRTSCASSPSRSTP